MASLSNVKCEEINILSIYTFIQKYKMRNVMRYDGREFNTLKCL